MARKTPAKPGSDAPRRLKNAAAKDKKLLRDIQKGLEEEQRFGLVRLKGRARSGKNAHI